MRQIKFYLHKESIVLYYYPIPRQRLRWFTSETINPDHWNNDTYRAKPISKANEYLNDLLDNMESFVVEQRRLHKIKGMLFDKYRLEELLDERYKDKIDTIPTTFYDYLKQWKLDKKKQVKPVTYTTYVNAIDRIVDNTKNLKWSTFNITWSQRVTATLKGEPHKYGHNSIVKALNVLRTVLNDATTDKVNEYLQYQKRGFVPSYKDSGAVYLNVEQLDKLYKYDYGAKHGMRNAINVFLIGCYTGQRWQNYKDIKKDMLVIKQDVTMIRIKQPKGDNMVSIPVPEILIDILNKNIKPISEQKMRVHLKNACALISFKRYTEVGTHTARRSFATNMLIAGVPKNLIMSITGHKTEREFNKYVRYDDIRAAIEAAPHVQRVFKKSSHQDTA